MSARPVPPQTVDSRRAPPSKRGLVFALAVITASGMVGIGASVVTSRSARYALATYPLGGVLVQDANRHTVPLVDGVDRVVLVLSTACPHCHAVVAALVRAAGGTPLPRLTVVALEGAARGQAMVDSLGLGAAARGPNGDLTAFLHRARVTATPVLLRLDARGYVRATLSGEITGKEADQWVTWSR